MGCRKVYNVTDLGQALTGLPVGHTVNGPDTKIKLYTHRPEPYIIRPVRRYWHVDTVTVPAELGRSVNIECEGTTWDSTLDDVYWVHRPCREGEICTADFVEEEGRIHQENMNTSFANSVIGAPVSKKLVITSVEESDFASIFHCILASVGPGDRVGIRLKPV